MKYKNILLHLDNSSGCRNRLEVAFALARKFDASLTGYARRANLCRAFLYRGADQR